MESFVHLPRHAFSARDTARAGDIWRAFQEVAVEVTQERAVEDEQRRARQLRMIVDLASLLLMQQAMSRAEAEALPVVDSYLDRRVVGLLTEAYALRRYSAELERRRQELVGKE